MSQLKYAILGLLNRQDMTGYDISKEFNTNLNNFWSAKHSQIYTELKKLTDEGFMEFKTIIQGEKLEKKLYSITEKGRQDFTGWMRMKESLEPTPKDKFRLKAFFSDALDVVELKKLFEDQLDMRLGKLKSLEDMLEILRKKEQIKQVGSPEFGDYIVLNGAIKRENAYIEWIRECLTLIR